MRDAHCVIWRSKCVMFGKGHQPQKNSCNRCFQNTEYNIWQQKNQQRSQNQNFQCICCQCFPLQQRTVDPRQKKLENTVNIFQRRHLRKILGIHWPKKITNIELYTKTKTEEWSTTIQWRRLNWLGHLMRLHPETPARLALAEYLSKVKRPKGRPQRTWMELIKHDLKAIVIQHS